MELDVLGLGSAGGKCEGAHDCATSASVMVRWMESSVCLCPEHARVLINLLETALVDGDAEGQFRRPVPEHPHPGDVVRFCIVFNDNENPRARIGEFTNMFREYLDGGGLEAMAESTISSIGGALHREDGTVTTTDLLRLERWIKSQRIACKVILGSTESGQLVDYNAPIRVWHSFHVDNLTADDFQLKRTEDL